MKINVEHVQTCMLKNNPHLSLVKTDDFGVIEHHVFPYHKAVFPYGK